MLISVIAFGEVPYKNDSISVLKDYFERNNLRYNFLERIDLDTKNSHPSWWKLLCHKVYKNEDYILNWDLDLLPSSKNTEFHKNIDFSKLGMAWDTSLRINPFQRYNSNFRYNGGLIGVPKSMAQFTEGVFNKHAPGTRPSYEQYYLNDEIVHQNIDVSEFPDDSNFLYRHEVLNEFDKSRFKHYTCAERNSLIKLHKNKYFGDTNG